MDFKKMYDFYAKLPSTREEIREYLLSWLQKIDTKSNTLRIDGETFVEEYGFVRAFHIHSVLKSLDTNEYVWWVVAQENVGLTSFDHSMKRYKSFDDLLQFVVEEYYTLWNHHISKAIS